jgi:NitT/TauT family transport system substrate-binding protein
VTDWINTNMVGKGFYEPVRFSGFPEIKESLASGHIQATFMVAPLAMALREQGVPIKIVSLGHRDGTAVMVHKDSDIRSFKDLKGKKIAVPTRYSNQYLIIFRGLRDNGLSLKDVTILEMPPPEMPTALETHSVDAICSGEPFMAKTQMAGFGRVLYQARDLWPNFISCVLVVREDVIREQEGWVQRLVSGIAKSGKWIDEDMENRLALAKVVSEKYYNQKPDLLRYVLSTPPDRVTYSNLRLARKEFEVIEQLAQEAGLLKGGVSFDDYADTRFTDGTQDAQAYVWHAPGEAAK